MQLCLNGWPPKVKKTLAFAYIHTRPSSATLMWDARYDKFSLIQLAVSKNNEQYSIFGKQF